MEGNYGGATIEERLWRVTMEGDYGGRLWRGNYGGATMEEQLWRGDYGGA